MPLGLSPLSLRWKLPLLFALSTVLSVTAFGIVAHRAIRAAAISATYTRLRSALGEINTITELGAVQQLKDMNAVAAHPAVVDALAYPDRPVSSEAQAVLEGLRGRSGAVVAVELVTPNGVVRYGGEHPTTIPPELHRWEMPGEALIGPMFQHQGTLMFEAMAPVPASGNPVGAVRVTRRLGAAGANRRIAARLLGPDAELLIGNRSGPLWLDSGAVEHPQLADAPVRYSRNGVRWVSATLKVGATPWLYAVDLPERVALAPARTLVLPFVLSGATIALVGALIALRLSRRITSPLIDLTAAAEAIARGERNVALAATGREDEVGRLARAFGSMATRVSAVREGLEAEVDARGDELRKAVEGLRQLHAELHRNERLAALGMLSGSVGHELRNPLSVMSNVVFVLDALPDASPRIKECATLLREQIRLSDRLIWDLLERARSGAPIRSTVELMPFLEDLLQRANVPDSLTIERRFAAALPPVMIDRDQVGQIVWNLVTNAMQAMQGSAGTLSLGVELVDGLLRIDVRDSGPGIAEADQERVFEPMYTTKAQGVGLGLSISRAFARAQGGDLYVRAGEGGGARFILEIPEVPA